MQTRLRWLGIHRVKCCAILVEAWGYPPAINIHRVPLGRILSIESAPQGLGPKLL